jgi:hypothetical protein
VTNKRGFPIIISASFESGISRTGKLLRKKLDGTSRRTSRRDIQYEMAGNDMTVISDRTLHSECNIFPSKKTRDPMEEL